ncbi:Retrotransposon protein [Gossypium australe]|uniref:Retrotransposon protein n=1 Tax=Gossypium australe TaxID=47621 RepID=A0A5B6VWN9_9ROSI|nr:Retrotransposon protein [Gossypium australe]
MILLRWARLRTLVGNFPEELLGTALVSIAPYHIAPKELKELKCQFQGLLDTGFIRPVCPCGVHRCFLLRKRISNKCPLLRINDLFNQFCGASVFSKIDFRSGYHQLKVKEANVHKTTFKTRYGHYKFLVFAFELTNALIAFMDLMNQVFQPYLDQFLVVFIDDILSILRSRRSVTSIFVRLFRFFEKKELHAKLISAEGIRVDPKKIEIFVEGFSLLVAPLTDLLHKIDSFVWAIEQQSSFKKAQIGFDLGTRFDSA